MADVVAVARALRQVHQAGTIPDYEPVLALSYRRFLKAGDTIFDIGAHSGKHLAQFADIVGPDGRLFAFEPLPQMANYLRTTYASNAAVSVHEAALSHTQGETQFTFATDAPEESGIVQRIFNRPDTKTQKITVRRDTIDHVATGLDRLDYIKIDIEGGEVDCLRGGSETIARLRPILSIEYGHPGYSVYGHAKATLFDWAADSSYLLTDLFGNIVESGEQWQEVCDAATWDYFGVPAEKRDFWTAAFSS